MIRGYSTFALALLLAACSGGGGTSTPSTPSAPNVPSTTAPAQATSGAPVATTFTFGRVTDLAVTRRSPNYVTTAVKSITIAVTAVNGNPPPSNVTPSVTSNVNITTCPCTVSGPGVPAGNDTFTLTAYDNANGTGNVISTASPTVAIVAAQANNNTIALNGVPASVMVTAPSGTAGTAATSPVSITVKDADAHAILGAYSAPITVSDADSSGATSISTSGSDNPAPGQILSSGDVASLAYTGLATSPVTLTASATGVATAIGLFAPALQPIVIAGTSTLNPSWAGVDFTAQTGGGSTGTMAATEVGWTNSPYNKTLQVTTDPSCSTIGTASITGTTITATASGSATAGSCPATVSNSIGQTATAVLAYTKFVFTGGSQSFALPANVTTVTISASGAQGGGSLTSIPGGKGATVTATLGSLSGTLTVLVGGGGGTGDVILSGLGPVNGGAGGFNGGGSGGSATSTNSSATTTGGGGGGGASSVSAGVTMLVVGGGGGGAPTCGTGSEQGSAGFPRGATGSSGGCASTAVAGIGGTQIVVGPGGAGSGGNAGADGSGGTGGAGGSATGAGSVNAGGGGGGGGFFGGGGGGGFVGSGTAEGGGGGSSFHAAGATNVTAETAGTHGGDGVVTLTL